MRQLSIVAIAFALIGCGLAGHQQPAATVQHEAAAAAARQEAGRTAQETFKARAAECTRKLPDQRNAVARAQCANDAMTVLLPVVPYPDLLKTLMAYRLAVIEQYQAGKITLAQTNAAIAQKVSELTTEEQNRVLMRRTAIANQQAAAAQARAAVAQESAADDAELAANVATWNAIRPRTCTYGAGTVVCF
jgi:hypothetical protein